jgi:glucose/arabinose dehydrogenase
MATRAGWPAPHQNSRTRAQTFSSIIVRLTAGIAALLAIESCGDQQGVPTGPGAPPPPAIPSPLVTDESVVLVGAGNIARCDRLKDEATANLLDGIDGTVFTLGDNTLGATDQFANCYEPSWGRHQARTRPAPGEREYWTPEAAEYFGYFGGAATGENGEPYYSYDLGAWHIIVLNSSIPIGARSAQLAWLKEDLAATAQPCVLAYWHYPRFSSAGTAIRASLKPVWDVLYAAQADVVVNAHNKVYERFGLQSPTEVADPNGIRQFTVGTGGQGVGSFSTTPRPNSEVRLTGVYGVLKLTLDAGGYDWEFVPIQGQTKTDIGEWTACHGRPGDPPPQANEAPTATMISPLDGALYQGGEVITYSGRATDPEEGDLAASRLTWWADFHHDDHTHPFLPVTEGVAEGSVTVPTVGETSANVWYRFYLRATDAQGATHTVFHDVRPWTVTLRLATEPAGLQVTLDGQPRTTPLDVTAVVGIERELGVVSPLTVGSTSYTFASWSDGGAATHTISTPEANTTYTATYAVAAANTPPSVSLTAPADGGRAEVNTPVTVSADASDADGTVQHVEFFDGTTPIGSDDTSPYSITWTPTTTGTRNLTARATDDLSAQTTSAAVSFTVTPPPGNDTEAPTVTLTAPADQATGLAGAVTLTATASDNVGVVGVQFQIDGENLGPEDTSPPYSATLPSTSPYTSGVHVLRARGRDAAGNMSAWDVATVTFDGSTTLPAGFSRTTHTSGLSAVTAMAFAPDGRLFICEQNGRIRVVPAGGGAPLATPFHIFSVTNSGEQGLLGIAFHPDFASNGRVYVYYTSPTPTNHNRVSAVVASASNPNVSTGVETVLLDDLPTVPSGGNHNGGALHFSPADGKLYLAVGDQGSPSSAPSLSYRFGKILRYNDDLTIPTDNPFYTTATGANRAIWARGLRNPFTFAFHPGTGRMLINDVGEATWEEVNEGVAGANYGWPTSEGPTTNPSFRSPIYAYRHSGGLVTGFAIVGAAFYTPPSATFPAAYLGDYFFADYVGGWINRLDPSNGNAVYAFARVDDSVFDLTVGPDGALYALAAGGGAFVVYRYQFQ